MSRSYHSAAGSLRKGFSNNLDRRHGHRRFWNFQIHDDGQFGIGDDSKLFTQIPKGIRTHFGLMKRDIAQHKIAVHISDRAGGGTDDSYRCIRYSLAACAVDDRTRNGNSLLLGEKG